VDGNDPRFCPTDFDIMMVASHNQCVYVTHGYLISMCVLPSKFILLYSYLQ